MTIGALKNCKKCGAYKPVTEFHLNRQARDGRVAICKPCNCAKTAAWVAANKERHVQNGKNYRVLNREKLAAAGTLWAIENRDRSREIKAAWKKRNPDVVRKHAREAARRDPEKQAARKKAYRETNPENARDYMKKRRAENPLQKVQDAMGNRMRAVLRNGKGGQSWRALAGYGLPELRERLQSQFQPGMTWGNYGEWQIDHIRPVASFDFSENLEEVAAQCWALSNLQPLWAPDNLKKGKKWDANTNADS